MEQGATLLNLQEIDLEILRTQNTLEELPEKKQLIKVRSQIKDLTKKKTALVGKRKDLEMEIESLESELTVVAEKAQELKSKLDSNTDHRMASQLDRDYSGQLKRIDKIEHTKAPLYDQLEQYYNLENSADTALAQLKSHESEAYKSLEKRAEELMAALKQLLEERADEAGLLDEESIEIYEDLRQAKGGIAVCQLKGDRCSVCGSHIQGGARAALLKGPEVNRCPSCKRLMVVLDNE